MKDSTGIRYRSGLLAGLVAILVLASGVWVYLAERIPTSLPTLASINFSNSAPSIFGALGGSLPTFAHVFAFGIFTALILGPTRRAALSAVLSWMCINIAFEFGQHSAIAPALAASLSHVDSLASYFSNGTFDLLDIVSIVLGTICAYALLITTYVSGKTVGELTRLE